MILSKSPPFIFVHVPKTAGSSVIHALHPYDRPNPKSLWRSFTRRLPFVESPDRAHLRGHETARHAIAKLSQTVWDSYFSFAVVRNPFDHAVSHYEFLKQYHSPTIARRFQGMSFEDYLADRSKPPFLRQTLFVRMPDQAHFLVNAEGGLAVNRILRFETLAADWIRLVTDIGLPGVELPHVNRTKAKSAEKRYTDYYTDATEAAVRRLYRRDFALLGYSDTVPARHGA